MNAHRESLSVFALPRRDEPILLELGTGDDALRYFALSVGSRGPSEFLLELAEASLVLDNLRLKRKLFLRAYLKNNYYDAELKISTRGEPVLKILGLCESSYSCEKLIPET